MWTTLIVLNTFLFTLFFSSNSIFTTWVVNLVEILLNSFKSNPIYNPLPNSYIERELKEIPLDQ